MDCFHSTGSKKAVHGVNATSIPFILPMTSGMGYFSGTVRLLIITLCPADISLVKGDKNAFLSKEVYPVQSLQISRGWLSKFFKKCAETEGYFYSKRDCFACSQQEKTRNDGRIFNLPNHKKGFGR
jgi:hypothetical protein